MSDLDAARRRFEVLKIARDLLNEQYLAQRTDTHSRWLAESEAKYKQTGELLPYPASPPYPSESDIINKATSLYKYVETGTVQPPPLSPKEAQAIAKLSPSPEPTPASPVTVASAWNTGPLPVEQHIPAPTPAPVPGLSSGVGAAGFSVPLPAPAAPAFVQAPVPVAGPPPQPVAPPAPAPVSAPSQTPSNSQTPMIFAQASNNLFPSAYAPSSLPVGLPLSFQLPTNKGPSNVQ